jgi:hypothetical protein
MLTTLIYISDHFDNIFTKCTDCETYIPPSYSMSSDIPALIVINEIVKIVAKHRVDPQNIESLITIETLQHIINAKCENFCQEFYKRNSYTSILQYNMETDNFRNSFYTTINGMVENYLGKI